LLLLPQEGCKVFQYLCLCVCLFACISQKQRVQISQNVLYILPVAMAQFFSDESAICYVLPVLWMTQVFT